MNEQESREESRQDKYSGVTDAMLTLSEVIEQLCSSLQEFIRRLKKSLGVPEDSEIVEPITIPEKPERQIPPRRTSSHARSPVVRRWWINYRARDKLPLHKPENVSKWRIRKCRKKNGVSLIQPSR